MKPFYDIVCGGQVVGKAQFRVRVNELGARSHPGLRGKVFWAYWRYAWREGCESEKRLRVLRRSPSYGWMVLTYCAEMFDILPIVDLPIADREPWASMHQPIAG
jgi:hypothetical protein